MNKPAYLVEGDLEQKFIQSICPGVPVRKINCNGDDVRLEAIAKRVGTLGRLLNKRCSLLVVVFDRESRVETSEHIEQELLQLLKAEGLQVPVIVGVPDRDIETWILADYEKFAAHSKVDHIKVQNSFEGKSGKSAIKRELGSSTTYIETIHGVVWLKAARAEVIRENSPSFARFANLLAGLECWWLQVQSLRIRM